MSYDLAVWEGSLPTSNTEADAAFERVMQRFESESSSDPSPRIRAFVDALLAKWPDLSEDESDDAPWAVGPLISDADGDAIYLCMQWSRCEEASEFVAMTAHEHGLVCYDPQIEDLRPEPLGDPAPSASRLRQLLHRVEQFLGRPQSRP